MEKIKEIINLKNIILFVILMILLGLIVNNTAFAIDYEDMQVDETTHLGYGNLSGKNGAYYNMYCIQRGSTIKQSGREYKLSDKVTIEGITATDAYGNTTHDTSNAVLAYILGSKGQYDFGYGYYGAETLRQKTLWYYWNRWINNTRT